MSGKLKKIVFAVAGLLIVTVFARFIINSPVTSSIPDVPTSGTISEAVEEQIIEARKKARRSPSQKNLGHLGMVFHSAAFYTDAVTCYELAIGKDENNWVWHYYLGYLYTEMSESDLVIQAFNRVIELREDAYLAWYYCAEEYMNRGEIDKAEEYFSKIIEAPSQTFTEFELTRKDNFPLSIYAKYNLARVYQSSGKNAEAERQLMETIQLHRNYGPAYRLLGNIYSIQGNTSLGEQFTLAANDLMVYSPPVDVLIDQLALISRSELYLQKKIDEAINSIYSEWALRLINRAMIYFSDNKYLVSKAMRVNMWLNNYGDALGLVDKHISLSDGDYTELYSMGYTLYNKDLFEPSLKYWEKVQVMQPGNEQIKKHLAVCYYKTGKVEEAKAVINKILEAHPDDFNELADITHIIFFEFGSPQEASPYLSMLERFIPGHPKVQKMLAVYAYQNSDLDRAIQLYSSSFEGDPTDLQTARELGRIMERKQDWSGVINFYRNALQYHPNDPQLIERLGSIRILCPVEDLRNVAEGIFYSERAFLHNESQIGTKINAGRSLAMGYAMSGDKNSATTIIGMTLDMARKENFPQNNIADLENVARLISQMQPI